MRVRSWRGQRWSTCGSVAGECFWKGDVPQSHGRCRCPVCASRALRGAWRCRLPAWRRLPQGCLNSTEADFSAEGGACQRCWGCTELSCLLRQAASSLLAVLACLIDAGFQIATTVPEGKRRSRILLRVFSWQGKARRAAKRAREELP